MANAHLSGTQLLTKLEGRLRKSAYTVPIALPDGTRWTVKHDGDRPSRTEYMSYPHAYLRFGHGTPPIRHAFAFGTRAGIGTDAAYVADLALVLNVDALAAGEDVSRALREGGSGFRLSLLTVMPAGQIRFHDTLHSQALRGVAIDTIRRCEDAQPRDDSGATTYQASIIDAFMAHIRAFSRLIP